MATLVTGLFKTRAEAERAMESLIDYGYSRDDISLLMSDATRGREFSLRMATKAPEGVATGATIGGVLGAVAAGLVALGIIVVPGLPFGCGGPSGRGACWSGRGSCRRRVDRRSDRAWPSRTRSAVLQ